jgi:hypothetical protein
MRQIPGDDFDLRPDWSELNNGQIPAHPVESAVKASLDARRIAHLRGDAGAGKTVLGLRLAHAALNAGNNIFWVTMRSETQRAAAAYHLLAKPDSLFVIDDAHTNFPEVQTLIDAFAERDAGDRLLILSTNIGLEQRPVGAKAIELNVEGAVQRWSADPRFLEAIAAYLAERLGKGQTATIPFGAGEQFVATFGARAGAFAIAVAGRLSRADPDPWNVSEADAVSWLQQRLRGWTSAAPAYDNLVYLAGIAAAGSEKWVPVDLLPHPGMAGAIPVKKVLDSGLTRSAKRAPPANLVVRLHQPLVMGPLILKALEKSPSDPRLQVDRLMFDILLEPQSTESIMKPLDDALQAEVANRVSLAMPMFVARSSAVMPFAIRPLLNWLKARDVNLAREFLLQLDTDPGWTDSALLARPALSGAGSLAEIIRQAGQSDDPRSSNFDAFADRLTTAMVRRCDLARDFQARGANIANLERTINLSHSATAAEKVVFLESIWRPYTVSNWLPEPIPGAHPPPPGFQRDTNRFSLGAFLYTTGLYQSESVVELLRRPDLTIVYFKWLARLIKGLDPTFRPPDYSSAAIQLLGAFSVLRVKVASSMLEQLPASKVARIPQEILPHRSTDIVIAPVQRRLWFGIREYVLRLNRELNMPAHLIEQTHALCLAHMTEYPPEVGFSATGYEHTNTLATWLHYALTHHRNRNVVVLKH